MENTLRQKARDLLESGEAGVVIGYGWNRGKTRTTPVFITKPGDADQLIFNPLCVNNLSVYLTRKFRDIKALPPQRDVLRKQQPVGPVVRRNGKTGRHDKQSAGKCTYRQVLPWCDQLFKDP